MDDRQVKWQVLNKKKTQIKNIKAEEIINILLENRGLKTNRQKKEFFNPKLPYKFSLEELGIDQEQMKKALKRIQKTVRNQEEIVIYGDYDADGICASAILWECLYSKTNNVKPYLPNRFEEGYGLNTDSIQRLKIENNNLKVIISVDNGIVAKDAVEEANKLGIDVIITDHHQKEKKIPNAYSIIHTDKICGSGIAWILAREINKEIKNKKTEEQKKIKKGNNAKEGLDLCTIGTIADQMPLIGVNRSFAKYGLENLNSTKRPGLLALFNEAAIEKGSIGTYEVNFIIAPRLNAMGRLEHAIDSLRLLCTKNPKNAVILAGTLGSVNKKRQKIVDDAVADAIVRVEKEGFNKTIIIDSEKYNEGVIGLIASKLVEKFYRPAIVISKQEGISKASARSIVGFNIIESIRSLKHLTLGGGGHPMAAGFSIKTENISLFKNKFIKLSSDFLDEKILTSKIIIDMELDFVNINIDLADKLSEFEPTGIGNYNPVFLTKNVKVCEARVVGEGGKHLRLVLEKNKTILTAIAFGFGYLSNKLSPGVKLDVVYNLSKDNWNGNTRLQLKIKDLRIVK